MVHAAPLSRDATALAGAQAESPAIEGWRGLAALLVLVSHYIVLVRPEGAGLWGMAATGVDVFFVLSGFVFARAMAQPGFAVGPHLVRRFFRLYPLYFAALLLYASLRPEDGRWSALGAHVLMLHTAGSLELAAAYNVAFWSLPPEVEFYLLLPVLAWVLAALSQRTPQALWALLMAALAMKWVLVGLADPGEPPDSLRSVLTVHAPGLLIEFLLGSAVAAAVGHVRAASWGAPWSSQARRLSGIAGVALFFMAAWAYHRELSTPEAAAQASVWLSGNFGLIVATAFALLLLGVHSASAPGLLTPLALWAGRLSYGVYLLHNAAPMLLRRWFPGLEGWPLVGASILLTLLMAALLHRVVEAPSRRYGRSLASAWERAITTRMSGDRR